MSVNVPDIFWTHVTPGGIPYKLVSQTGGVASATIGSLGTEEVSEVIIIQTNRLGALVAECFPVPVQQVGGLYYPPRKRFPGLPYLHVIDLKWEAMDEGKPIAPYAAGAPPTYYVHCRVTLIYAPYIHDFLQISCSAAGTFLHGEMRAMFDEYSYEILDANVPNVVLEVGVEWTFTWSRIPEGFFTTVLLPRMRSRIGKVNNAPSVLWSDAPAETILFVGFDFSMEKSYVPGWGIHTAPLQCTMKFMEKNFEKNGVRVTHQHFWLPGADAAGAPRGWQRIRWDNGTLSFDTTDMDRIFSTAAIP